MFELAVGVGVALFIFSTGSLFLFFWHSKLGSDSKAVNGKSSYPLKNYVSLGSQINYLVICAYILQGSIEHNYVHTRHCTICIQTVYNFWLKT